MRNKYLMKHNRLFTHARFAEATDAGMNGGTGGGSTENGNSENETPSVEELMAQLSEERAKVLKLQNEKNAASTDAANYKKLYKERMTQAEQDAEEQRLQREAETRELEELKAWKRTSEAVSRYKVLEMDDKTAQEAAKAEVEGDFEKLTFIFDKHTKAIKAAAYQQFLADRPDIKAGTGDEDKNSAANERAVELGKRTSGKSSNILDHYRR